VSTCLTAHQQHTGYTVHAIPQARKAI